MHGKKLILVAGPTASGKSATALALARKNNGTVINADAMQVYEGLPILSAQPKKTEQAAVPHLLYGILDPGTPSSAGKWLALAHEAIADTLAAGRTPILTGGTGLYFRALLGGLAEIPPIPDETREKTKKMYETEGEENFRRALAELDPGSAEKLARNDRQRLIRAYEVAAHTGKTLKEWHGLSPNALPETAIETHMLLPARDDLYAACDKRFLTMLDHGALAEAENFLKRGLDPALPAMKTIGLRELGAYLKKETTLDEAIAKARQATRNYAKRQMTWFRNQKLE